MPPGLLQLVSAYNEELLSLERLGHTMLVERLVELIRVGERAAVVGPAGWLWVGLGSFFLHVDLPSYFGGIDIGSQYLHG